MKPKYLFILGILFLLVLPLTFAQTQERDRIFNLKIPFIVNGTVASTSATCNVSIDYPDGIYLKENVSMTNRNNGDFNITLTAAEINQLGTYEWRAFCCDGSDCAAGYGSFEVTETGHTQETSQAIGSFGFLIMMIAITILLGIIGFKLSETENLWILGIFFLFLMLLFLVFDIYLGYEYRLNFTGADNDSSVIEILFYSFLFLFTTGVAITIVLLFRKWHKIVDWFKAALKNDAEPDDDYFSGKDGFN